LGHYIFKNTKIREAVKRIAILEMNVDQPRKGWDSSVDGLSEILKILRDECGVLVPGLIPYTTILIPMAAVWPSQATVKGADAGANRIKLLRRFWCSVLANSTKTPRIAKQKRILELKSWMSGGGEPESVQTFTTRFS
jgi:hypothetical protein